MSPMPIAPPEGFPAPTPVSNPETQRFWDATSEGRLLLTRCPTCDTVIWYPKALCVPCGGVETEWFEAAGTGTIYSFTIVGRGHGPYQNAGQYVLAVVELTEGPRVITNIVSADPSTLSVEQEVTVVFHDTGEGVALPRFEPV